MKALHFLDLQAYSSIFDIQTDKRAGQVAAATEDGTVLILQQSQNQLKLVTKFKAPIWKVDWAPSCFGEILAVGSFRKRVSFWQNNKSGWDMIAQNNFHQGSVNFLQFAPQSYGFLLFSAGSDGFVSYTSYVNGVWNIQSFQAHEMSINMLRVQPDDIYSSERAEMPRVLTCSRDKTIRIWNFKKDHKKYQLSQKIVLKDENVKAVAWKTCQDIFFTASQQKLLKMWIPGESKYEGVQIARLSGTPWRINVSESGRVLTVMHHNGEQGFSSVYKQLQFCSWQQISR